MAKSGVACKSGVRQVTWTAYAAACVPKFSANNGGATFHGVTANQITVVLRLLNDSTNSAIGSFTNAQLVADIQHYLTIFNNNFETYGRKVVLETYNGQGNGNLELEGQGQAQAEADAQTAYDMGAFADADPLTSNLYIDGLSSRHIISLAGGNNALYAYQTNAPYEYATPVWNIAQTNGTEMAAVACQRLVGMPAKFSSDALFQRTTRVFGSVEAEQPAYAGGTATLQSAGASHCGLHLATTQSYSISLNGQAQEAIPIIAALKSKGVTTVFFMGDPIFLAALTNAADSQAYHPEWMLIETGSFARDSSKDQMQDAIQVGFQGQSPVCTTRESTKVLTQFGFAPQSPCGLFGRDIIYWWMLQFFNAVQNAGPDLTPATFRAGWARTPPSTGGYGLFSYNPNYPDVAGDFTLAWWNPNATSNDDGQPGSWLPCNNGARYVQPYPTNLGSGQPQCGAR